MKKVSVVLIGVLFSTCVFSGDGDFDISLSGSWQKDTESRVETMNTATGDNITMSFTASGSDLDASEGFGKITFSSNGETDGSWSVTPVPPPRVFVEDGQPVYPTAGTESVVYGMKALNKYARPYVEGLTFGFGYTLGEATLNHTPTPTSSGNGIGLNTTGFSIGYLDAAQVEPEPEQEADFEFGVTYAINDAVVRYVMDNSRDSSLHANNNENENLEIGGYWPF